MSIRCYRSAFILLFVVLLVLTVSSVAYNAYRRASEVSLDLSANTISEVSRKIVQRTVAIFDTARGNLEVDALVVGDRDIVAHRDELLKIFWKQVQLTPQLLSGFVADARGSFVQARELPQLVTRVIDRGADPPQERILYRDRNYRPIAHIKGGALYEPTSRPWYLGTSDDGKVRWSSVYRFTSIEKLGVTASKAVLDSAGRIRAVVGADIALEGLSEFLAEQRIAKGGVGMIVDSSDRLVAFPYQLKLKPRADGSAYEGTPRVSDLADAWLVDAYRSLKDDPRDGAAQDERHYSVSRTHGARYISHVADLPLGFGDEWRLFIVVPEASLLSAASRVLSESFIISVIILRQRGTVDKYLSDTVMAFWGAPLPVDDGTERACLAALQCRRADDEIARTGIGKMVASTSQFAVHTGPVIVGTIGSLRRMSYTAIGENVEFAMRLKQLNLLYGTRILVTGAARQDVEERFWWRRVDVLSVEDLEMEIELFELIDERSMPLSADTGGVRQALRGGPVTRARGGVG